ncbi:MAG TPA: hypothetical protein VFP17_09405 [Solirubrobacterales bacterium]|nr:hypothetical protein [Solirubrobacterales bacterium]
MEGPQRLFLGEVLVVARGLYGKRADTLARGIPKALLDSPPDVPIVVVYPGRIEEAVALCARIIRERWFGGGSRAVGYECMRILLERDKPSPWPAALTDEIERELDAYEAGRTDEARLVDSVGSWIAEAEQGPVEPTA